MADKDLIEAGKKIGLNEGAMKNLQEKELKELISTCETFLKKGKKK